MELNSIIFPAPHPSYTHISLNRELIYIPRSQGLNKSQNKNNSASHIPCLFLPFFRGSTKLLIYFHGNAEDVGLAYDLLEHLKNSLMIHVLAIEQPGYGVYKGKPSSEKILVDCEHVMEQLINNLKWKERDIILFGRSIGTGPATHLASKQSPCVLLLMSAYTSIQAIVAHLVGRVLQWVVKERFRNIDNIQRVYCPTFFIHGVRDPLIPYKHSEILSYKCSGPTFLLTPPEMDHNEFDFFEDLSLPFNDWLISLGISVHPTQQNNGSIPIPENLQEQPTGLRKSTSGVFSASKNNITEKENPLNHSRSLTNINININNQPPNGDNKNENSNKKIITNNKENYITKTNLKK